MSDPPFDVAKAHRWFAIECNNRAWDLVEQPSRTAAETQEMIDAAHAAAIHWRAVGTPLNEQRAQTLLATAYLKAGKAEPALRHAQRCLALSNENAGQDETPFDRATALAVAASAHDLAGDANECQRLRDLALATAAQLPSDDRAVFDKLYS